MPVRPSGVAGAALGLRVAGRVDRQRWARWRSRQPSASPSRRRPATGPAARYRHGPQSPRAPAGHGPGHRHRPRPRPALLDTRRPPGDQPDRRLRPGRALSGATRPTRRHSAALATRRGPGRTRRRRHRRRPHPAPAARHRRCHRRRSRPVRRGRGTCRGNAAQERLARPRTRRPAQPRRRCCSATCRPRPSASVPTAISSPSSSAPAPTSIGPSRPCPSRRRPTRSGCCTSPISTSARSPSRWPRPSSTSYRVDAVVDTGDLVDWGTPPEQLFAGQVGRHSASRTSSSRATTTRTASPLPLPRNPTRPCSTRPAARSRSSASASPDWPIRASPRTRPPVTIMPSTACQRRRGSFARRSWVHRWTWSSPMIRPRRGRSPASLRCCWPGTRTSARCAGPATPWCWCRAAPVARDCAAYSSNRPTPSRSRSSISTASTKRLLAWTTSRSAASARVSLHVERRGVDELLAAT